MNIEIANRLIELRKKKGYTQESLADALGISRQAVSKWERAEASPDTDNLICLAKLYGVSLDELLQTDETIEELRETNEEKKEDGFTTKSGDKVTIGPHGIHIIDKDGSVVDINMTGIHIKNADGEPEINNFKNFHCNCKRRGHKLVRIFDGIIPFIITLTYCLLGGLLDLWHPAWILFVLMPFVMSIPRAIYKRKLRDLNIPCLITSIYLFLGCVYNLWHPYWALFLIIPVFYIIFDSFNKHDDYDSCDCINECECSKETFKENNNESEV